MRKFLFLPLLALLASCGKNEDCDIVTPQPEDLVSLALYATLSQSSTDPYNGPLEVLPCETNGSFYIGNYTAKGKQVPFPAYYLITNGIGKSQKYPLRLPVGLRKIPGDTVYYPIHSLVYGTQNINIGKDDLQAHLKHASAALSVIVSETNGDAFSDAIDSMWIYISNIHSNLNYFSARPEGTFKTISFGLKPSTNRTEFNNNFVSVFPSQPNPMFQIFVQLSNGTIKHYQQKLTTQLNAGTRTTVNLSMDGVLLEEGDTGEFQIDKWKEQHDSIHISLN